MQDPEGKYEALTRYARDLTAAARDGKLDPVIGRDDEIRRCIQILSRRTKNNPVLIGEPGVGKTAVAEGASIANLPKATPKNLRHLKEAAAPLKRLSAAPSSHKHLERSMTAFLNPEDILSASNASAQGWHSESAPGMSPPRCRTGY